MTHVYTALGTDIITHDIFIKQLVSVIIKSGTYKPRTKSNIMPVEKFTNLFITWDNDDISIKELRMKAISLLALTVMLRPSDVAPHAEYLDDNGVLQSFIFGEDQVIFKSDGSMEIVIHGNKNDTKRNGFCVEVAAAGH